MAVDLPLQPIQDGENFQFANSKRLSEGNHLAVKQGRNLQGGHESDMQH